MLVNQLQLWRVGEERNLAFFCTNQDVKQWEQKERNTRNNTQKKGILNEAIGSPKCSI